jgi:hypothetical protein
MQFLEAHTKLDCIVLHEKNENHVMYKERIIYLLRIILMSIVSRLHFSHSNNSPHLFDLT